MSKLHICSFSVNFLNTCSMNICLKWQQSSSIHFMRFYLLHACIHVYTTKAHDWSLGTVQIRSKHLVVCVNKKSFDIYRFAFTSYYIYDPGWKYSIIYICGTLWFSEQMKFCVQLFKLTKLTMNMLQVALSHSSETTVSCYRLSD